MVNSMECLDWLENLLQLLWLPGDTATSPYRGLPLVILALDDSLMGGKDMYMHTHPHTSALTPSHLTPSHLTPSHLTPSHLTHSQLTPSHYSINYSLSHFTLMYTLTPTHPHTSQTPTHPHPHISHTHTLTTHTHTPSHLTPSHLTPSQLTPSHLTHTPSHPHTLTTHTLTPHTLTDDLQYADTPICKRARVLANRVQCVLSTERPTVQPKRLVVSTVIPLLLSSLIDSIEMHSRLVTFDLQFQQDGLK